MLDIKKDQRETEEQFLWRVGQMVDSGQIENWSSINNIINKELLGDDEEKYRTESAWRKRYQAAKSFYLNCFSKMDSKEHQIEMQKMNRELAINTVKYRDERNAWSKQNYAAARVDETMNILKRELIKQGKVNFDIHDTPVIYGDNDLLCVLSDLHIGATFKSLFGEYNTAIAKQRLEKYLNKILEIQKPHNSEKCIVLVQGDIISGSIHKTLQISNKENVIEQIKIAIELISSFCYELTKHFTHVHFYNVVGNHGRLVENKEDTVHRENLDDLIGWSISKSLSHINNFHYLKYRHLDIGIADLIIRNKTYIAVHGNHDKFDRPGVLNLCSMLGFFPEAVLYGHMHSPAYDEVNGVKMIRSGSLCGSGDDYTITKRLTGEPSQAVLVCDMSGIRCIYNVNLK